jgi:hypothetical protein
VINLEADANTTNKTPAFNITFSSPQARLADLNKNSPDRKLEKISFNISGWLEGNKRRTEFENLNLTYELDKPYNPQINDFGDGNVKRLVTKADKLKFTQSAIGNKPKIGFEGAIELVTVKVDPDFAGDHDTDEGADRLKTFKLTGKFIHGKESFKMIVDANIVNAEKINTDKKIYSKFDLRLSMDANFSGFPSTTVTLATDGTEHVEGKAILTIAQKEKGRSLTFSAERKSKETIKQFTVEASDGTRMIIKKDEKDQNSGIITVNDKQVATITDERFIKIKYKDGTFDSL